MSDEISILNVVGLTNEEFIAEVTVASARIRNEVYFALGVNGLPGDPSFGVGLLDLVGEGLDGALTQSVEQKLKSLSDILTLSTYVGNNTVVGEQMISVDVYVRDTTSQTIFLVPVAFPRS